MRKETISRWSTIVAKVTILVMFFFTIIQVNLLTKKVNESVKEVNISNIIDSDVFVKGLFGLGAGTVIKKTDSEMYILTCHHVVEDIIQANDMGFAIKATIGYTKKDSTNTLSGMVVYGAKVIKYDADVDLALLKVNTIDNSLVAAPIAAVEPQKGDILYSVGSPLGLLRTISTGILANKEDGYFIFDGTTTFGNSGGGLYNRKGELVGVPSNVTGYKTGLDKDGNETFVPESGLGLSRDLMTLRSFLGDLLND